MSFMRSYLLLFLLLPAASLLRAAEAPLPLLRISQEVHDLELNRESPKYVLVAGYLTFQWYSKELPGFAINRLDFLNNIGEVEQSVEENSDDQGFLTITVAFRGKFECHNNFSAYPFNIARIPIIFKKPPGQYTLQAHSLSRQALNNLDQLPQSDSYSIIGREFVEGVYYKAYGFHGQHEKVSEGDILALGLFLDVEHKPLRTLILVLLPLLTIWGVSYSSQWWKEESAASRGVMASLFAATAVAIASTSLAPNVSCPTAVILTFCCYYISLIVLGVLTVMAFREKTRAHPEEFRRVRLIGRIIGPVMLLASVVLLTIWVLNNRHADRFEWLDDPKLILQAGSVDSAKSDKRAAGAEDSSLIPCLDCGSSPMGSTKE
jgi:hypothetical protein